MNPPKKGTKEGKKVGRKSRQTSHEPYKKNCKADSFIPKMLQSTLFPLININNQYYLIKLILS